MVLCLLIFILPSGCWSRKEPKTLALVNSALYDLGDTGGFEVTIEVLNPAAEGAIKGGGNGKSPNITAISEGDSVPEAVRNVSESLERTIFGGHNKVRFFSERFAKTDMILHYGLFADRSLTDENPLMVVIRSEEQNRSILHDRIVRTVGYY
jgi:hypothetical protein